MVPLPTLVQGLAAGDCEGAGSRTPCLTMGLHPGTRPSRRPALQVRLYQIPHAILEGRAPARPVSPRVSIPGPGRHGGRPSR